MPTTERTKPWWQSITILAGVFMLLNAVGLTGLQIDWETGDFSGNIYDVYASVAQLTAGAAAIFGRLRAATRIGKGRGRPFTGENV